MHYLAFDNKLYLRLNSSKDKNEHGDVIRAIHSSDGQMIDASHGIVDVVRPAVPRGLLLEHGVEPFRYFGEMLFQFDGLLFSRNSGEEILSNDVSDDGFGARGLGVPNLAPGVGDEGTTATLPEEQLVDESGEDGSEIDLQRGFVDGWVLELVGSLNVVGGELDGSL